MGNRSDNMRSDNHNISDKSANDQKDSGKIAAAVKTARATSAIIFFGIPVIIGTVSLLGYGASKVYKRIFDRS